MAIRRMHQSLIILALVLVGGCGSSGPQSPSVPAQGGGAGGHGARPYAEPVRLTQGEYKGLTAMPVQRAQGELMQKQDDAKPRMRGWVGGVFIYDSGTGANAPKSAGSVPRCSEAAPVRILQEEDLASSSLGIPVPPQLPPGAFAFAGQWGAACGDEIYVVERRVTLLPAGTEIVMVRQVWLKAVDVSTSADRVSQGSINGKSAAFVAPVTADGYGNAEVLIKEDFGLTRIRAIDVSFEELKRVAESL